MGPWIDRVGGTASTLCLVHCLAVSAGPTALSVLGLRLLDSELFEWGFFSAAVSFAALAGVAGVRSGQSPLVLLGFGIGTAVLVVGRLGEALQILHAGEALSLLGGGVLIASHVASALTARPFGSAVDPHGAAQMPPAEMTLR